MSTHKFRDKLRQSITTIDTRLLAILVERRSVSKEIAQLKSKSGTKIRDHQYEQELLAQRIRHGRTKGLDADYVTKLYHAIIEDSVLAQQAELQDISNPAKSDLKTKVAYLGGRGSFSHQAATNYFLRRSRKMSGIGCSSFQEIIDKVESGLSDCGILPIENSTSGNINEVYDLLQFAEISIIGEMKMSIEHCLLVRDKKTELEDIRTFIVHPQVHAQCSQFLTRINDVRVEYCSSTSTAMAKVGADETGTAAAIGGRSGGDFYGLHVIREGLANYKENYTRFVIIAKKPVAVAEGVAAKTSVIFSLCNEPGTLVDALLAFKGNGINLLKLESRPIPGNPWEEIFYVELAANLDDQQMQAALAALTGKTRYLKVLGSYPSEDVAKTEPIRKNLRRLAPKQKPQLKKAKLSNKKKAPGKAYRLVSRDSQPENTVVRVGNAAIGGDSFVTIAGPCAVESEKQIFDCAEQVKGHGGDLLRGGCFKPRTNPYSFQGLGYEGLDIMERAGKKYHLPIVTEVLNPEDVVPMSKQADVLQIGARNMQNFGLLKEVGKVHRPVLLKRGMMASLDELLNAAEYILAQGNRQVILCERGIRTFETATRNTLDLSAIPILKELTHLPVIVDPSHAVGRRDLVIPMVMASKAVGAHGIIVEIHPKPEEALSDGPQALRFPQFAQMMTELVT
jgi:chorismate mutase/prephenate dehydratase